MNKIKQILITLLILLTFNKAAYAFLSLNINSEDIPKTKILFLGFNNKSPVLTKDANEVLNKIKKNLKTTDLFEIVEQEPVAMSPQAQAPRGSKQSINLVQEFDIEALPEFEKYN